MTALVVLEEVLGHEWESELALKKSGKDFICEAVEFGPPVVEGKGEAGELTEGGWESKIKSFIISIGLEVFHDHIG